jgi:hypothetical protein
MVLGADVGLEETCRLALCGMVGRLSYSSLADTPITAWVHKTWTPILGYVPEMSQSHERVVGLHLQVSGGCHLTLG